MVAAVDYRGLVERGVVITYTIYIHDQRYAVPTLLTAEMADDARVRDFARERLAQSEHYRAVEIWEDDRLVGEIRAGGETV